MAKAKKKVTKKSVKKNVKAAAKKKVAQKGASKKSAKKVAVNSKAKPSKTTAKNKAKPKKVSSSKKAALKKGRSSTQKVKSAATRTIQTQKGSTKKATIDLSKMKPLDDRIVVRLTEMNRKTPGGLFIPDTVSDVSGNLEGQIVACGTGHRNKKGKLRPMDVKIGDRVLFSEYAGTKVQIENQDFIILRESDVTGVMS